LTKGYIEFFSSNAKYRRLWAASVISLLGEWFNTIALFLLILEYSGSEFLLGILFSVRMILFGISQPINGLLADRLNRKSLMLWSNIAQIFLALTFLMVDGPEDMWWLISVSGIMMLFHGVYVTAERAAVPNIVDEDDLITANAIGSASWSTALCTGAMLGGVVVSQWGTDAAFVIDSLTFLLSAIILVPLIIEQTVDKVRTTGLLNLNGIPTPNTVVKIGNLKNLNLEKNYLIKPIFGSQGKNIFLLDKLIDLKKIHTVGNVFYLQEFLKDPKKKDFWDLRVLVSNHKVISVMKRISKNFITNVYQGAETEKIPNNKQINDVAKKVSKIFKLGYGGIDIIYHKKKYYILEVNSIPSWKAMQKLEKRDISKIIVQDFLQNLKKKCRVNY